MQCADIRERLARGEIPNRAEEPHLASCASCAVAHALAERDALALDTLLLHVEARIERERGGVAWLRARPTRLRWLLAAGIACASVLFSAKLMARGETSRMAHTHLLALASYAVLGLLVASEMLRPLHRTRRGVAGALLWSLALLAPWFGALQLGGHTAAVAVGARHGCMWIGFAVALPLFYLFRALDRGAFEDGRTRLLAIGAAALAANAALALCCPSTSASHLLAWHAPIGVLLVAGSFSLRRLGLAR